MTPREGKNLAWEHESLESHIKKLEALKSWTKKTAQGTYFKMSCETFDGDNGTRAELGETDKILLKNFIDSLIAKKKKRKLEIENIFKAIPK